MAASVRTCQSPANGSFYVCRKDPFLFLHSDPQRGGHTIDRAQRSRPRKCRSLTRSPASFLPLAAGRLAPPGRATRARTCDVRVPFAGLVVVALIGPAVPRGVAQPFRVEPGQSVAGLSCDHSGRGCEERLPSRVSCRCGTQWTIGCASSSRCRAGRTWSGLLTIGKSRIVFFGRCLN
jgi:hypothetical protein